MTHHIQTLMYLQRMKGIISEMRSSEFFAGLHNVHAKLPRAFEEVASAVDNFEKILVPSSADLGDKEVKKPHEAKKQGS